LRSANGNTWTAQGTAGSIKVIVPNAETPALGTRYRALCSGMTSDGYLEFVAIIPGGATVPAFSGALAAANALTVANAAFVSPNLPVGYDAGGYYTAGPPATLKAPSAGYYAFGANATWSSLQANATTYLL